MYYDIVRYEVFLILDVLIDLLTPLIDGKSSIIGRIRPDFPVSFLLYLKK